MQKRNKLSYETSKLLFDSEAEGEIGNAYIEILGNLQSVRVEVPLSVMHRLFRLGQAYGLRQLRYFSANTKLIIGQTEIREFNRDLKKLTDLLNDDVLNLYIGQVVIAIEAPPGPEFKHIAVSTGDYFEERT